MLNINDLTKRKRERKQKRIENYKAILKICHNKILNTSNSVTEQEYLFFTIPNIIFGQPLINIEECSIYLIDKLIENGFNVKYLGKGCIFISWKHINNPKYITKSKTKPKLIKAAPKRVSFNPELTSCNTKCKTRDKSYRSIQDIPCFDSFLDSNF